jgi:hypothetical protein
MAGVKGKPNYESIFPSHWRTQVFFAPRTKMTAAGDVMPRRTAFTPE